MSVLAPARGAPRAPERAIVDPQPPIAGLLDAGSFAPLRSGVVSRHVDVRDRAGDGVIAGVGAVAGRPVAIYRQDPSFMGGSLGEAHAETIVRVIELAREGRFPIVGVIASAGARLQEGVAALHGYARIFNAITAASGEVPQISLVSGAAAGGAAYTPAMTDFVVMTADAHAFLTGPSVVREVMGEDIDAAALGGPRVHDRNGVAHLIVPDEAAGAVTVRRLLAFLPQSRHAVATPPPPPLPQHTAGIAGARDGADPSEHVPVADREVYDVRDVITALVDDGDILELAPRWARNMVTALVRIEGRTVGVLANQPRYRGGIVDAEAAQKGARFVRTCNSFAIPLVVLVDTPGFMPGAAQERVGVIRHGAKLLHAFGEATVPSVTVVLRKAFGGAYIVMNSRGLGADTVFAWPDAQIGVMGPRPAVQVMHRRQIAALDAPPGEAWLGAREDEYRERHCGAAAAARLGVVDEVIDPLDTRARVAHALWFLAGKARPDHRIPNLPL